MATSLKATLNASKAVIRSKSLGRTLSDDLVAASRKRLEEINNDSICMRRFSFQAEHVRPLSEGDRLLIKAVKEGDIDQVVKALEREDTYINCRTDEEQIGQTPLILSTRYGHPSVTYLLLQRGAEVRCSDQKKRSAWYYACFSASAAFGTHWKCLAELVTASEKVNANHYMMAAHSNQPRVLLVLLEHLGREIKSRDSNNWCHFVFSQLHMLDDPTAQIVWPDGSVSSGLTTICVLVNKEKKQALIHPSVKGLLHWKWKSYGRFIFFSEMCLYGLALVCISTSAAMMRFDDLEGKLLKDRALNIALQFIGLSIGALFLAEDLLIMIKNHKTRKSYQFERRIGSLLTFTLNLITPILTIYDAILEANVHDAASRDREIAVRVALFQAMALNAVQGWLRFVNYFELFKSIGSFFIMVERILKHDLPRWMIIVAICMPGFSLAFNLAFDSVIGELLHSARNDGTLDSDDLEAQFAHVRGSFLGWEKALYAQWLVMFSLDSWPRDTAQPVTVILLVMFVIMMNLISVNLLIAMMSSTYDAVKADALAEWNFRWARFITERGKFLNEKRRNFPIEMPEYHFWGHFEDTFPKIKEDGLKEGDIDALNDDIHKGNPGMTADEMKEMLQQEMQEVVKGNAEKLTRLEEALAAQHKTLEIIMRGLQSKGLLDQGQNPHSPAVAVSPSLQNLRPMS